MDAYPDYITVVRFKRTHHVRYMQWSSVADGYVVRMEWKTRLKKEADQMAKDWAEQRGVAVL